MAACEVCTVDAAGLTCERALDACDRRCLADTAADGPGLPARSLCTPSEGVGQWGNASPPEARQGGCTFCEGRCTSGWLYVPESLVRAVGMAPVVPL